MLLGVLLWSKILQITGSVIVLLEILVVDLEIFTVWLIAKGFCY